MRNPFAVLYRRHKRIWAPNPFVVLLRNAQTDLAVRIWTILVPIRLKKTQTKNGFGPFSYKFFVPIRVGLTTEESTWQMRSDSMRLNSKRIRNFFVHKALSRTKLRAHSTGYVLSPIKKKGPDKRAIAIEDPFCFRNQNYIILHLLLLSSMVCFG